MGASYVPDTFWVFGEPETKLPTRGELMSQRRDTDKEQRT